MHKPLITLLIAALAALTAGAQSLETFSYSPSTSAFCNPERGIFTHQEFHSGDNFALTDNFVSRCRQEGISLMFLGFVMEDYRSCLIPESYLQRVRQAFATLRRGGMKATVRFSYSFSEDDRPWDVPWDLTRQHIAQLRPILRENADVIAVLEAGFVGVWGEWYYTENYNFEPRTIAEYQPRLEVLKALLEAMPPERFIAVRYPDAKLKTLNITYADTITAATAYDGSTRSRISYHNDGFLATSDDYGTFQNKSDARKYWMQETRYVPMGGETAKLSSYCSTDNAAKQMANYHWSYINKDYHPDVISKWETEGFYATIDRKLGYRLYIKEAQLPTNTKAGEPCPVNLTLCNAGWAAPYNPRGLQLILRNTANPRQQYAYDIPQDPRHWQPEANQRIMTRVVLPAEMPAGDYDVALRLADPMPSLTYRPEYCIRLANNDMWDAATGLNVIRTIHVNAATGPTSPYGIQIPAVPLGKNLWAGRQTSLNLTAGLFADVQFGDTLQLVTGGETQQVQNLFVDGSLIARLKVAGYTATAPEGTAFLAVNLIMPDHTATTGLATPLAAPADGQPTYRLTGQLASRPDKGLLIAHGRKVFK